MSNKKRKIYRITLWLYPDDAKMEINEFHIKRKGEDSIQTQEGETLYCYMLDKPSSGVILGDNCIDVSMITEDISDIEKTIGIMAAEGRKKIDEQIQYCNNMHSELNYLEKLERDVILCSEGTGYSYIKKNESEVIICPFGRDSKPISIKEIV